MSERFFVPDPLQPGPFQLEGREAHHLTVSRLRAGDELVLFNGDGCEYRARIATISRRAVDVDVLDVGRPQRELPFRLEIAASVPKGDRSQFLIEKLTELGVTTFIPLACQRSLLHPRDVRRDKLQRYVIEASKQCGRNVLMEIADTATMQQLCASASDQVLKVLADPAGEIDVDKLRKQLARLDEARGARFAVGPEGGFTDAEREQATSAGWLTVNLGSRILRVETAAIVLALLGGTSPGTPSNYNE
jgi:16S rRNA (uracil1498-N3)-methyltransferase